MNKNEVEELLIYKQYLELIYYTTTILLKYPKLERYSLNQNIRHTTYEGLECILYAYRLYNRKEKIKYLIKLDIKLKFLKALIRISYPKKYINAKNYAAWSKKIFNIGNMLGGWIVSCQNHSNSN